LHKGEAMDERDEQFQMDLSYYMDIGAVNLVGMDENGEAVYEITELAQEIAPELWQAHVDYVDQSLLELFEQGLLNIEYDENLEATIHLTKEGYEVAKQYGLINLDEE
jgi:predicted transcriptional regulator